MWRALVMATGISMCILGGECMIVDRVVMTDSSTESNSYAADDFSSWTNSLASPKQRVLVPPEWAPWGLLSGGVLSVLYAGAISRGGD